MKTIAQIIKETCAIDLDKSGSDQHFVNTDIDNVVTAVKMAINQKIDIALEIVSKDERTVIQQLISLKEEI